MSKPRAKRPHRGRASRAPIFAALGDETRLELIGRLSAGPALSIARLTEGTALTRQGITKHLTVLREAGLVRNFRRGRETLYRLDPAPILEAQRSLDSIARQWEDALQRLKAHVDQ